MNGMKLVTKWVWYFCGRPPSPQDRANGEVLDDDPGREGELLAEIAACDEAFNHLGGMNESWLSEAFRLIANRLPTPTEYAFLLPTCGNDYNCRLNLTRSLVACHYRPCLGRAGQ